MAEPTRPVTISAVSTGPSSRTSETATSRPVCALLAPEGERWKGLDRQYAARKEPGKQDDGQRADANHIHLRDRFREITRTLE